MNELEHYVDTLFSKYKRNKQIAGMKDEILSNLQAKVADLTASGMNFSEAVQKAKKDMNSIDFLIEGNKKILINQFRMELMQWSMIYFVSAWILTIPLLAVWVNIYANLLAFAAMIGAGVYYLILNSKVKNNKIDLDQKAVMNCLRCIKVKKIIWLLWFLFAGISVIMTSMLYFGSNIWFSRPVHIDGPYAFAALLIRYFVPFLTIVVPMIGSKACKLFAKYEAGEDDEE